MLADIVVGLQHGDEAKGKVTHRLCEKGKESYTHVLRYNGGGNAGHTIYHNGQKFITHYIPAGVFHGIKSILGSGCVINVRDFFKEIRMLKEGGIDTSLIKVANNCHVITEEHLYEDVKDEKIGTTKRGNGPAYRDKYYRQGQLAEDVPGLKPYLIDLYKEFHENGPVNILCEGAQGFGLDIDWGDYPYVTSSHCTAGSATLNAIPPKWIRNIWGVGKVYETYVGKKNFEPDDNVFNLLRHYGQEYGSTTGRPRQCNWLNLDELLKAVNINGATHVVLNKTDVLDKVKEWKLYHRGNVITFDSGEEMCEHISSAIKDTSNLRNIVFSGDKHGMDMAL
jgi:adenylosuccinate synthase